jgi:precorrin-6B methylase 2
MRGLLKVLGDSTRFVWVADSFAGLPEPDHDAYPADAEDYLHTVDQLAVSLETVRENFARFDLLDENVQFLKGYFKDTLYTAPIEKIAVLRMDGDMYQSTWETLDALYPKLSPGGYLIIDDYARENCAKAVHDYREKHGITEEIIPVDWTASYWRKQHA